MISSRTIFVIGYDDTDYVDVIPVIDCAQERRNEIYVHRMVGPTGRSWPAESLITVEMDRASLVYPESLPNILNGVDVGTLTLLFDKRRSRLISGTWSDGKGRGREVLVNVDFPFTPVDEPILDEGGTRTRDIVVRKGQGAFRNGVLAAYGFTCAISRCTVLDALEAAHISPFAQGRNQNPRNGILLRRDLHALFDAELLGLNPDGSVSFHPSIRCTTYRDVSTWHRPDQPSLHPDREALAQRWDTFSSVKASSCR